MNAVERCKRTMHDTIDLEYSVSRQANAGLDRETLETEFLSVGLYVAGVDNNIETIEIDLLNYLFDKNYTPQMMGSVIKVLSEAYNGLIVNLQMPGWMLCKAIDEAEGTQEATTMYILTVDMIMTLFGAVDGNLDAKEERFIQDFVNRLKRDR